MSILKNHIINIIKKIWIEVWSRQLQILPKIPLKRQMKVKTNYRPGNEKWCHIYVYLKHQSVNGISIKYSGLWPQCGCQLETKQTQWHKKKKNRKVPGSLNYSLPTLGMSYLNQPKGAHSVPNRWEFYVSYMLLLYFILWLSHFIYGIFYVMNFLNFVFIICV